MGVATLISWLVTAFIGLYLVAVWLIENDVSDRGAIRSRLPGQVIGGHVLLAFTTVTLVLLTVLGVGGARLALAGGPTKERAHER
jgi:uncharacterized membrane protein YozB (DUF420 family)